MFGRNPLRKKEAGDGSVLEVKEIFGTLQGEGPHAGAPAIFVRLAGCNLACYFCDTAFDDGAKLAVDEIVNKILEQRMNVARAELVVLTGGEPLRQNVVPLITTLRALGYRVQIETAGTLWPEGLEAVLDDRVDIVVSPKTGKVHANFYAHAKHWKYLIATDNTVDDYAFPMRSTQVEGREITLSLPPPGASVYYQPMEAYIDGKPDHRATAANVQRALEMSMRYGHRLSLQVHKILNLP